MVALMKGKVKVENRDYKKNAPSNLWLDLTVLMVIYLPERYWFKIVVNLIMGLQGLEL